MKIRIQLGYQDIRKNNEDIMLTPFIGGVFAKNNKLKCTVLGLSINWIFYSIYIGFGFNVPKKVPHFLNHTKK